MKKLTALILALAMCFALAACGGEPEPTPTPMPSAEELAEKYASAIAQSLMNVQAYCVGLFMPAEGKAEAVTAGLEKYIEAMQQSFENYLPDQGVIADNAVLETLDDGSILLVMSPEWDSVHDGIVSALEA